MIGNRKINLEINLYFMTKNQGSTRQKLCHNIEPSYFFLLRTFHGRYEHYKERNCISLRHKNLYGKRSIVK